MISRTENHLHGTHPDDYLHSFYSPGSEEGHMDHTAVSERVILTTDSIREHIGNPTSVLWVEARTLLEDNPEGCVDGREEKGTVGTPGGNAGEFVLMVQAAENLTGRELSPGEIGSFFGSYLEKFGKFYMHSDEHALHHLQAGLAQDVRFNEVSSMEELVRNCPSELQDALLEHVTNPDNMGCGHLKLMIKNAQEYGVRPEIVVEMVRNYYRQLWVKNEQIELRILPGDHVEGAVVNITVADETITADTEIPTISPLANGTSFFTNHPQATDFLRRQIAEAIVNEKLLGEIDLNEYNAEVAKLGGHYLGVTVNKLAKDEQGTPLPIFEVKFTSETEFTVTQVA